MALHDQLEKDISKTLSIKQGKNECKTEWISRLIYSVIAKSAYASLWDIQDYETSIIHFKRRCKDLFSSFKEIYPENFTLFTEETENQYVEYIYNLYLKAGFFYKIPDRITYSNRKIYCGNKFNLIRSPQPGENVIMSGMGYLTTLSCNEKNTLSEVFNTTMHTLESIYLHISTNFQFKKLESSLECEYLRTKGPFRSGYWKQDADKSGVVSLLRIKGTNKNLYYLYKYENNQCLVSLLPDWMVADGNYRELSCSIMKYLNNLPSILYDSQGAIVKIKLDYLLPPKDLIFLNYIVGRLHM